MESGKLQLGVGLFVFGAILTLIVIAVKVSNLEEYASKENYTLTAHFNNIGGLKIRSAVKVGGVVVGRVKEIALDKDLTPVITMSINSRFNTFPSETSAAILTAGLLGDQYISLTPGGDEDILQPGDEIADTQSAIILEDLIGQLVFNKGSSDDL